MSAIKVTLVIPDLIQLKAEAAIKEIEREVGFPVTPEEIYLHALSNGIENIATDYIDAVLIAAEKIKQRELPISELANLSKG